MEADVVVTLEITKRELLPLELSIAILADEVPDVQDSTRWGWYENRKPSLLAV